MIGYKLTRENFGQRWFSLTPESHSQVHDN